MKLRPATRCCRNFHRRIKKSWMAPSKNQRKLYSISQTTTYTTIYEASYFTVYSNATTLQLKISSRTGLNYTFVVNFLFFLKHQQGKTKYFVGTAYILNF